MSFPHWAPVVAVGQRGTSSLRSFRDEEEQLAGPFQCLGGFKKNPLFKSLGSWKFFKVDPPQSRVIHCLKPSNFKRNSTLELNQVLYLQVSNQVCAIFTVSRWARARPGPDVSRASASHKRIQGFSERKLSTVLQIDLFCRFTWVRKFEFESRQLTHKGGGRAKNSQGAVEAYVLSRLSDRSAELSCRYASLCCCHTRVKEPRNYLPLDCTFHGCRCLICTGGTVEQQLLLRVNKVEII